MKIVIDTNVIVAAFRSRQGASNRLLRLVETGAVRPLCSTALFLEYEAVLGRPEIRAVTGHSVDDVRAIMNALAGFAQPVDVPFKLRPSLKDADDEMVFEAAVNGRADAIVTHNIKDFAGIKRSGLEVLKPRQIIERLTS